MYFIHGLKGQIVDKRQEKRLYSIMSKAQRLLRFAENRKNTHTKPSHRLG